VRVLDSIHEDGPKLVEMAPEAVLQLRAQQPGIRIVPVVYFYPAVTPRVHPATNPRTAAVGRAAVRFTFSVVSRKDGSPIAGATVVFFTDFAHRMGSQAITNAQGSATVTGLPVGQPIERVYVYAQRRYWNLLKKRATLAQGMQLALRPLDLGYSGALQHFYGTTPNAGTGSGVTVGVIDTGIAPHPDLVIAGGQNLVVGEDPTDFGDNGEGHGTHVAGIIAGRGTPPTGMSGLAPAVTLRSYRVFGQNAPGASNYSIAKAIDYAAGDGRDLLNLSLGGPQRDEATRVCLTNQGSNQRMMDASTSIARYLTASASARAWDADAVNAAQYLLIFTSR
jgi:subtilisin